MAVTNYYTIGDEVVGERAVGGSRKNYVPDALGSVTGTLLGGSIQNTYAYTPYGAQLSSTGVGSDPMLLWVGVLGYAATGRAYSGTYMRARYYSYESSRWTSQDPMWPLESPFSYARENPASVADPIGLAPVIAPLDKGERVHPKQCCCCVQQVKLDNVRGPFTGLNASGHQVWYHSFDVNISYSCHHIDPKHEAPGEVDFEWWEKSNFGYPLSRFIPFPDWWTEQSHKPLLQRVGTLTPWFKRAKPCPGTVSVKLTDYPSLQLHLYGTATRTLCIHVRVASSWYNSGKCRCGNSVLEASAMQVLPLKKGEIGGKAQFVTPYDTGYCKLGWKSVTIGPLP